MLATDPLRRQRRVVISGGMESMTGALLDRQGPPRLSHGSRRAQDSMFLDGLEDAETGAAMGTFAQATADAHQLSREAMDAYAIESVTRARRAIEERSLDSEISPIGDMIDDEQPGRARLRRFRPCGRHQRRRHDHRSERQLNSDGASALVLASGNRVQQPLARIAAHATHSQHPAEFTLAPVGAISKLLAKLKRKRTMTSSRSTKPRHGDHAGHGAVRIAPHGQHLRRRLRARPPNRLDRLQAAGYVSHALHRTGGRRGIAALCIGGGEATAAALERD